MDVEKRYRTYNMVDLANVSLQEGRIIPGHLLRSASLDSISAKDWARINATTPVKTIIDLRQRGEIPSFPVPYKAKLRSTKAPCIWANLPLDGLLYLMDPKCQTNPHLRDWKNARLFLWSDPLRNLALMYQRMLESQANIAQFRNFFDLALLPRDGALLWHCRQGTDRTGLVTLFVLGLLDATNEAILDNYSACVHYNGLDDRKAEIMESTLAYLEKTWGGVIGYLESEIGITPEYREAFIRRFTY